MSKKNFKKMSPSDRQFWQAEIENSFTWIDYFNRLVEIAISIFEWKGLPDTVDVRFLELGLWRDGMMLFFKDEVLEEWHCLRTMVGGTWSVYDIPNDRRAYATNGYQNDLNENNSVLIYNNMLHIPSVAPLVDFAKRLENLDRTIDVNVNAQKTPVLIETDDKTRLTLQNVYKRYEGNAPVIYGDKKYGMEGLFTVLKTDAPFIADKLYELRTNIWNDALTYIGVPNVSFEKKERVIRDEVNRGNGGSVASRFSRLNARRQAAEQMSRLSGFNITVDLREELDTDTIGNPPVAVETKEEEGGNGDE